MNPKQTCKLPPAGDFRTTFTSSRGSVLLAEHALSLPVGTPARAAIQVLLERRETYGVPFDPDEPPALDRDAVIAMYQQGKDGIDFAGNVCAYFGITDDDLDGEAVDTFLAEAA